MHRDVIFKNGVVPDTVFSAFEGTGEDLRRNALNGRKVLWLREVNTASSTYL